MTDKFKKPNTSESYRPSSEPVRIYCIFFLFLYFLLVFDLAYCLTRSKHTAIDVYRISGIIHYMLLESSGLHEPDKQLDCYRGLSEGDKGLLPAPQTSGLGRAFFDL
jgi:hypothetical protein